MALTRFNVTEYPTWSPFRQLSTLRDEIDRLFESPLNLLTTSSQQFMNGWLPAIDLYASTTADLVGESVTCFGYGGDTVHNTCTTSANCSAGQWCQVS